NKDTVRLNVEPLSQFVNTKLTAKLNRQLEEPLVVASNCLPSWAEDLATLYPFLFPFETRHLFLQSTSFGYARSMTRWQNAQSVEESRRDRNERPFLGRLQRQKVRISRSKILESALKVMELYGASQSILEVEYFEEVGTGLGPTLEFYSTVSKEFSKKKLKLWREMDSHDDEYVSGVSGLFPRPLSADEAASANGERICQLFKTLGKFVARSMIDSRIIDLNFNPTFFRITDGASISGIKPSLGARRVASLPPITSETFNEKVLQARAVQTAEAEKALFERSCEACQKNYSSENAYQNHLTSSKHKLRLAALGRRGSRADDASSVMSSTFSLGDPIAADKESVDSDAEEEFTQVVEGLKNAKLDHKQDENRPSPVKRPSNPQPSAQGHRSEDHPVSDEAGEGETESSTPVPKSEISWTLKSCIFCNYDSPTVPLNAHHMERFHNMFIPEKQYLVDLEGLLQHLLERVHEGHQCLYCFKTKNTAFAVQTHMRDKGHCKVPFDTEETQLDIGDFYDFRSTYSDDEESDE
ncbi:hypothetical protein BN1723_017094, partial [Verticillium longisporum]